MCLGIPMQVIEGGDTSALCAGRGERRRVSLMLCGPQAPGSWLLVHIDTAVRALDAAEAGQIDRALDGLEAALNGEAFEHLFADLIDREPQLPDYLLPSRQLS
jgi:hydrogenase expression/formation protein HypC